MKSAASSSMHADPLTALQPIVRQSVNESVYQALRNKLTQAERGHFINAAIAAVRPLTDRDRSLTGAKLTDTSGTDC